MRKTSITMLLIAGLVVLAFTACGGGTTDNADLSYGTLSLSLTDATTDQYQAIYITIREIQVHMGGNENNSGNWTSLAMSVSPLTLDLLQLVNGVREELGFINLPSGRYTQMRLILDRSPDATINVLSQAHPHANYLITNDSPAETHELKVPSGFNSGVKIVNGFDILENSTTELVLDFDACRSVVEAGSSGNWHLKPTIKVAELHEYAIIQGNVTDGVNGIEGALVSLQTYDGSAVDAGDQVSVVTATITDDVGDYSLFVAPGAYQLVAYKNGRQVSVARITAASGQVLDNSETRFALASVPMGQVTGAVSLVSAGSEQYATLSFRQSVLVDTQTVQVEVGSLNILDGGTYTSDLPAGNYTLAATSSGYATETYPLIIPGSGSITQDVTLNP